MYENVYLDGKQIIMKNDLDITETGISNESLLIDTIDLSYIIDEIDNNDESTNEGE